MQSLLTLNQTMILHYAVIAFYITAAMGILRTIGAVFGPPLKPHAPKLYAGIATTFRVVSWILNDALGMLAKEAGQPPPSSGASGGSLGMRAPLAILLVALLGCLSCGAVHSISASGTVSGNPTSGDIAAGIGVSITFAQIVDTQAQPFVAADSQLTAAQKAEIERLLAATGQTLSDLKHALADYQTIASTANKCRLYAALSAAIHARVDILATLESYGVVVPPTASLAVQSAGAIADSILAAVDPACASSPGPDPGALGRSIRARLRLQ